MVGGMNAIVVNESDRFGPLRLSLRLDALVSAVFGALLLVGAPLLAGVLGAPPEFLSTVGGVALAYAAALWLVASRELFAPRMVWTVIALNTVWAVLSVLLVVLGLLPLTALGTAFVLLQALVVAGLADLQFVGLRRAVSELA